jgi:signal transduction histidine kinase
MPLRLLVVEDSAADAELLIDSLNDDGLDFECRVVDDAAGFRDALKNFKPQMIVSDMSMPGFSGYDALDILRTQAIEIPFIFVSGTMGEETAIEALKRGATDYLLKGNLARFASSVRRALREDQERRARQRAEQELLRAQRYESLALLAGGLSHDLRNILQPLLFASSIIKNHDDVKLRKLTDLIDHCTRRGLEIVDSMLSFARGAGSPGARIGLATLLKALRMLLQGSVPRNVSLDIQAPDAGVELDGNHTELQQCLLNLCLNALQAMPEGGQLTVSAKEIHVDKDFFSAEEALPAGAYVRISVTDTGVGMSDEVRSNLFKPFYTTKVDGTGLGLLSCKRLIGNHNGALRAISTLGKGSTFEVYLPLPAAISVADAHTSETPRGAGQRILLVVEELSTLSLLCDTLALQGYDPLGSSSGSEALQKVDEVGAFELVVVDADMSLMNGTRTIVALQERKFAGPILLMVRAQDRHNPEALPNLPRVRLLTKPVAIGELLRTVSEELQKMGV